MDLNEDIKALVIARLQALPSDKEVSFGQDGSFNKEQLIQHVEEGDALGQKIADIELTFLRSLKDGVLYE